MKHARIVPFVSALALALVAMVAPARADQEPDPQFKADAAEGWIHLFNRQDLFGWTAIGDAEWKVENGVLSCEKGSGGWLASTSPFQNFELEVTFRVKANTMASIAFRAGLEGHFTENGSGVVTVDEPKDGGEKWHVLRVVADGDQINADLDGTQQEGLAATRSKGVVGIVYHGWHFGRNRMFSKIEVNEVRIRPIGMKPLFDGKTLDGWNIIPGRKSVFTVVDGAINIKDGNGQIETVGTYKDFVLQLDIFSNGKNLNSGVFYRGPVGVFWKGYESQVRNHWTGDDRTAPVDFGTGGNYGNQPTRRVNASDGEWFHKTIVCDGNHASVFINGYLVSDFTDVRPVAGDNDGKIGYVPGPGTFHLQGHDPTTDLSFRSIRIQETK